MKIRKRIVPKRGHNHEPDLELLKCLKLRNKVLCEAQASTTRISETFKNATRGEQGACLLSVVAMNRTMLRWRRGKTPPPPLDAIDADRFLRDDQYRDSVYAKHYIGLVQGDEGEYALLFGSRENLNYLGAQTKLIQVDGTFRTAPATSRGRFYQNLMFHAKFKAHVMPFFKAIMTGNNYHLIIT